MWAVNLGDGTGLAGVFRAATCSPLTNFDTALWVGDGCPTDEAGFRCLVGNDDNAAACSAVPGSTSIQSAVALAPLQSRVVYVLVGSYGGVGGEYSLNVTYALPSPSPTPVATPTSAQTPTPLPSTRRFASNSILVLRGGSGATLATNVAYAGVLAEYTPSGAVLSNITLPNVTAGAAYRCMFTWTADVVPQFFIQRSWDALAVTIPCSNGTTSTFSTLRGVSVLRPNGTVDTVARVSNMFNAGGLAATYRTVASVGGAGFWATGSSTETAGAGMFYMGVGAVAATRGLLNQAVNQRFVTVGPSHPGSGQPASLPMLYM